MHPSPHKKSKKTFAMSQTNIQFRPLSLLFFGCFFGLITLIISPATQATPETSTIPDEEQPIQITADRLEVQEQKGISTYTGNVHIQQGSLELSGDTVTIQHPNGQLQTVKAYGTPAKFKRFSQIDQAWLTGQANLIQYNTEHKTILLSGDAQVKQPGKHFITGRNIFYDIAQQTLMAKGSKDGQERVSVTFDPASPKTPNSQKTPEPQPEQEWFMAHFYARNLAKSYKNRQVVTSVDIDIYSGQVVGLLGPNGAGKTTTFYMMMGLVANDAGQIFIDDQEITQLPIHKRAKLGIGYLPQEASVFRKLTVAENIHAILEMRPELKREQRANIFQKLVDDLQIGHILNQPGQALSGGERRRVEIARALAMEPRFILLDEPFAGVDPISVKDIQSIIFHLKKKNIGVLITDHNVREILGVCDYAYILHNGTILATGTPKEILEHDDVKRVYLGEDFKWKIRANKRS